MKILLTFVCLVLATQSYTMWDNWHNIPSAFSHPWTSNSSSTYTISTVSGWTRNGVTPLSYFSNYTWRATQYLNYMTASPSNLIFCGPRTFLVGNLTLCQRDPFYWDTADTNIKSFCIPDVYGTSSSLPYGGYQKCSAWSNALKNSYPCCFLASGSSGYSDISEINALDNYSSPRPF